MKISLLLALCLSAFTFASEGSAATLKQNMKALNGFFKQISADVNDPSKNAKSAEAADQMIKFYSPILDQVPDAVAQMPAPEREAALAEYKRIIQQQSKDATALKEAFLANDNAGAATLIQRMNADKKDGHAKFRSQN